MFDLYEELRRLRDALDTQGVPYALCGGLAVGIHGHTRATEDIDILIRHEDCDRVFAVAEGLGFRFRAHPMTFAGGATEIRRVSKIDAIDGDVLILDVLLVTPAIEHAWDSRESISWNGKDLWVVSKEGLIALKLLRSSAQDKADIEKLKGET